MPNPNMTKASFRLTNGSRFLGWFQHPAEWSRPRQAASSIMCGASGNLDLLHLGNGSFRLFYGGG